MFLQEIKQERDAAARQIENEAKRISDKLGLELDKSVKLEWHKANNVSVRCMRITKTEVCGSTHTHAWEACVAVLCRGRSCDAGMRVRGAWGAGEEGAQQVQVAWLHRARDTQGRDEVHIQGAARARERPECAHGGVLRDAEEHP